MFGIELNMDANLKFKIQAIFMWKVDIFLEITLKIAAKVY